MSTNFNKSNFLSSISNLNNDKLLDITENIDNVASYVLQTKPKSKVKIFNTFQKQFLRFNLKQEFFSMQKKNKIFCKFFTVCGS